MSLMLLSQASFFNPVRTLTGLPALDANKRFGMCMSKDGSMLFVANTSQGLNNIYIYRYLSNAWSLVATKTVTECTISSSSSIKCNEDGTRFAISGSSAASEFRLIVYFINKSTYSITTNSNLTNSTSEAYEVKGINQSVVIYTKGSSTCYSLYTTGSYGTQVALSSKYDEIRLHSDTSFSFEWCKKGFSGTTSAVGKVTNLDTTAVTSTYSVTGLPSVIKGYDANTDYLICSSSSSSRIIVATTTGSVLQTIITLSPDSICLSSDSSIFLCSRYEGGVAKQSVNVYSKPTSGTYSLISDETYPAVTSFSNVFANSTCRSFVLEDGLFYSGF